MRLILGLIVVLILTIIPLPFNLSTFRPSWALLLILLTELYYPHYFKLWGVILLGLLVDSILCLPLGLHSLSFIITAWLASSQIGRFHVFSQEHQMILIGFFCLINEGIIYLVNLLLGFEQVFWPIFIKSLLGALLWPLLKQIYVVSQVRTVGPWPNKI